MQPIAPAPAPARMDLVAVAARRFGLRWRAALSGDVEGTRLCRLALAGWLLGVFLLPFDAMRVLWLAVAAPLALAGVDWKLSWKSAKPDALRLVAAHFLSWMTARSLAAYGMVDGGGGMVASGWLLGTLLLVVFAVLVWHAAQNAEQLESLGLWVGCGAATAAALSGVLFYVLLPGHVFGERLMNAFVYGGWNPVSTGLTSGFAAMWLVCLREKPELRRWRALINTAVVVLIVAVCFTRSRGALLALVCGHIALSWAHGLRRTWLPWTLLFGVVALFIVAGPLVSRVALWQAETRAAWRAADPVASQTAAWMQDAPPASEMLQRGDSGRLELYQRALQGLTGADEWVFGLGQWGPAESCCRSLSRLQYHLHSAFLATLVHGGAISLGLVLAVVGIACRRAGALAREGQGTWVVLLSYGLAGLMFDGQTFTSITSIPQMETLLVAFPLVAAASIWWHRHGRSRHAPSPRAL